MQPARCLTGCREDAVDETQMMRQQMNPGMAVNPAFDATQAFKAEVTAYTQVRL